ncbi:MAG: ribonuclease III [Clostridiales bacterium]|nr:ribonuclease III [Clostridiales bacterium]PWL48826.1 MAG: ribonuclease III [Clostridiales bacterium]
MEESVKPRFRLAEAGPLTLAYMGDAVFELLTRERIVLAGEKPPAELNRLARGYVTAVAQSAAVERLLPLLDEDETAVYKRGRNAKSAHAPKSAGAVEYRRATGLECLFGYLYLAGRIERARALFEAVCAPEPVITRDAGKDG